MSKANVGMNALKVLGKVSGVSNKIIELIPSNIQKSVSRQMQAVAARRIVSAHSLEAIKSALPKKVNIPSNIEVEEFLRTTKIDNVRSVLNELNVPLTFTLDDWPRELAALGYRPIPGYDYSKTSAQLKQLFADPTTGALARDVWDSNLRATYELWSNPSSPVFRRIVGDETDPVKVEKLINKARREAAAFYPRYQKELELELGSEDLSLARLAGMQGPLSRTTAPTNEGLTRAMQLENTADMYRRSNFPKEYVDELGVRTGTHYGGPSIDDSNAVLLAEKSWLDDPTLLNAAGKYIKAPTYVRNILNRLTKYKYPNRPLARVATADSNFVYSGLGAKPFGTAPGGRALADDQELYNILQDSITRVGSEYGYTVPADFQAAIWSPVRELFEGDVADVRFLGRPLDLTQEAADALRTVNPDPRGYRDRMVESAAAQAKLDMDAARAIVGKKDRAEAIAKANKKRAKQLATFEKIYKSNPKLMSLLLLAGTTGAAGAATQFDPLRNIAELQVKYGGMQDDPRA